MKVVDHPLFSTWANMRGRCLSPTNKNFDRYGGRGIYICERWNDFGTFVSDVGEKPANSTLDRKDNDGPYSPENCRWISKKQQSRNRHDTVLLTIDGVTYTAIELAEKAGVKTATIVKRHEAGLSYDELLRPTKNVGGKATTRISFKTHCPKGHEYTEANSTYSPKGWRRCRECGNERMRLWRAARTT